MKVRGISIDDDEQFWRHLIECFRFSFRVAVCSKMRFIVINISQVWNCGICHYGLTNENISSYVIHSRMCYWIAFSSLRHIVYVTHANSMAWIKMPSLNSPKLIQWLFITQQVSDWNKGLPKKKKTRPKKRGNKRYQSKSWIYQLKFTVYVVGESGNNKGSPMTVRHATVRRIFGNILIRKLVFHSADMQYALNLFGLLGA